MKSLASLVAIGILLPAACYAQHCSDPISHRAEIGGDAINGSVVLQDRPLKAAKVHLFFNGKTIWVGLTDSGGSFHIKNLRPGTYRLTVEGWSGSTIRISSDLTKRFGNGQVPYYWVLFIDNKCVWTVTVMN